jgi:hypothetical protein
MLDSAMSPEQDMKLEDEIKQQILHAKKVSVHNFGNLTYVNYGIR